MVLYIFALRELEPHFPAFTFLFPILIGVRFLLANLNQHLEWQEYCNQLREEKLRALGVILADETPTVMPASTTTARGQTPLVSLYRRSEGLVTDIYE